MTGAQAEPELQQHGSTDAQADRVRGSLHQRARQIYEGSKVLRLKMQATCNLHFWQRYDEELEVAQTQTTARDLSHSRSVHRTSQQCSAAQLPGNKQCWSCRQTTAMDLRLSGLGLANIRSGSQTIRHLAMKFHITRRLKRRASQMVWNSYLGFNLAVNTTPVPIP